MTPAQLRDLRPTTFGDDDETPADSFERRAMVAIARRTRNLIAATMAICALAFVTSAVTFAYLVRLQPRRDQAATQRAETLEAVRQIRAALRAP